MCGSRECENCGNSFKVPCLLANVREDYCRNHTPGRGGKKLCSDCASTSDKRSYEKRKLARKQQACERNQKAESSHAQAERPQDSNSSLRQPSPPKVTPPKLGPLSGNQSESGASDPSQAKQGIYDNLYGMQQQSQQRSNMQVPYYRSSDLPRSEYPDMASLAISDRNGSLSGSQGSPDRPGHGVRPRLGPVPTPQPMKVGPPPLGRRGDLPPGVKLPSFQELVAGVDESRGSQYHTGQHSNSSGRRQKRYRDSTPEEPREEVKASRRLPPLKMDDQPPAKQPRR